MTCKHDTGRGHHNPSDPQSTKSVDCKLATGKDESFSSEAVKNLNTTDSMDELAAMKQPSNPMGSLIPRFTLQRISKRIMKEAVEQKKVELKEFGTKIPVKDVDVLRLVNTLDLYGLINDSINKYNNCNTVQGFTNDMVGNADAPTVIEGINKAPQASKLGNAKPVVVHENNHDNTKLTDTELESNNTLGVYIVEEIEGWYYEWADTYDKWNNYYYTPTKDNKLGSSHTFTGDNSIFKLTKTKHNGKSKTRLVSEVPTSVKSDFYIGKRQK